MIRAVFFDVGGTLITPWPSVGSVYAQVAREFGLPATEAAMEQAFRQAWKLAKSTGGWTSSDKEWWRGLVRQVLQGQGWEDCPGYFEALYAAFAEPGAWRVFPDVAPALQVCRQRGWQVGVLSNWDERLRPLLGRLELSEYFDSLTISCEVGAEKPSPVIFAAALRAAGIPADAALHIGDSVTEDVAGATAAGWRAIQVRQPGAPDLREVISSV